MTGEGRERGRLGFRAPLLPQCQPDSESVAPARSGEPRWPGPAPGERGSEGAFLPRLSSSTGQEARWVAFRSGPPLG